MKRENGIKYEVLTCAPDVEEAYFRSLPAAATEAHARLGEQPSAGCGPSAAALRP